MWHIDGGLATHRLVHIPSQGPQPVQVAVLYNTIHILEISCSLTYLYGLVVALAMLRVHALYNYT